jgi:hypothetical protein
VARIEAEAQAQAAKAAEEEKQAAEVGGVDAALYSLAAARYGYGIIWSLMDMVVDLIKV